MKKYKFIVPDKTEHTAKIKAILSEIDERAKVDERKRKKLAQFSSEQRQPKRD